MERKSKNVIPRAYFYIKDSVCEKNNPMGISGDRSQWATKLTFDEDADHIFFAGCGYQTMKYTTELMNAAKGMKKIGMDMNKTLGFAKFLKSSHLDVSSITAKVLSYGKDDTYSSILVDAVNVLQKLDVKLCYLGSSEPCCGSPLYYSGFAHEFKKTGKKFVETMAPHGVKNVVGMIPACTNSVKSHYAEWSGGEDVEVKHFIEVVHERLLTQDIRLRLQESKCVTYHDPCQLSRYLGVIDAPRAILRNIDGLNFVEPEPEQTGKWSTCCGGGGGLEVTSPELSEQLAKDRVTQLQNTGATTIVTSCPFCLMQLKKGVQKLHADIEVLDMAQLLAIAMGLS